MARGTICECRQYMFEKWEQRTHLLLQLLAELVVHLQRLLDSLNLLFGLLLLNVFIICMVIDSRRCTHVRVLWRSRWREEVEERVGGVRFAHKTRPVGACSCPLVAAGLERRMNALLFRWRLTSNSRVRSMSSSFQLIVVPMARSYTMTEVSTDVETACLYGSAPQSPLSPIFYW